MRDTKQGAPGEPGPASERPASTLTVGSGPGTNSAADTGEGAATGEDGGSARPISADMQQFIGRQLRAVFDDVAQQPIPDRFLELMRQLDGKAQAG